MERNDRDERRARETGGEDGRADGMQTPGGAGTGGPGLGDTRTEGLDALDPPEDRGRYDPDTDRGNRGVFGGRAGGTGR